MLVNNIIKQIANKYPFNKGRNRLTAKIMKYCSGYEVFSDDFGSTVLLNLDNYIDCRIFLEGTYSKDLIETLSAMMDENSCTHFFDIGANIGVFSISISKINRSCRSIYSFEPDPRNYAQLTANIFLNHLEEKIKLYNIGLSNTSGTAAFYRSTTPLKMDNYKFNSGTNSLNYNMNRHSDIKEITIKKLDDIVNITDQKLAIKIDVEGHEYEVLSGMENVLTANKCLLLVEVFPDKYYDVTLYLSRYGFNKTKTPESFGNNYIYTNY